MRRAKANYLTLETRKEIAKADGREHYLCKADLPKGWDYAPDRTRAERRALEWLAHRFPDGIPAGYVAPPHAQPVRDAMAWHAEHQAAA